MIRPRGEPSERFEEPSVPSARPRVLFVSDLAPVLAAVKASPDAKIMNVSGSPSPQNNIPWLVIRLPGGSTYLQIVGLPTGRVG